MCAFLSYGLLNPKKTPNPGHRLLTMTPAPLLQGLSTSSPFLISQLSFSAVTTISPSTASRGVLPESRDDTLTHPTHKGGGREGQRV